MSASDFSGKVVIITGSSSGIGQSAAVLFSKLGASVTIHGRSKEGIQKTKDLILETGIPKERIHSVQGDITDPIVQKAMIEETVKNFGRIDILINNAGGTFRNDGNQRSMEALDFCLNITLKAPIALTELAIPYLEKSKGCIINTTAPGGQKPNPILVYTSIAKAGLDHFARNYAAILAPMGIRVNNLSPGLTDTPAINGRHNDIQKMAELFVKQIPLGRIAKPEEMAEFMAFIASDKASYMTGQIIVADGGLLIHSPTIKFD
jgi:NAD(P)-dependent dehydrogenase (short-subunit alcohol dehydrogenase family)